MRRKVCIFLIALLVLSISACGFYQTPTVPEQAHAAMTEDLKVLLEPMEQLYAVLSCFTQK